MRRTSVLMSPQSPSEPRSCCSSAISRRSSRFALRSASSRRVKRPWRLRSLGELLLALAQLGDELARRRLRSIQPRARARAAPPTMRRAEPPQGVSRLVDELGRSVGQDDQRHQGGEQHRRSRRSRPTCPRGASLALPRASIYPAFAALRLGGMDERVLGERLIAADTSTLDGLRSAAGFVQGWLEARDIVVEDLEFEGLPVITAAVGAAARRARP